MKAKVFVASLTSSSRRGGRTKAERAAIRHCKGLQHHQPDLYGAARRHMSSRAHNAGAHPWTAV